MSGIHIPHPLAAWRALCAQLCQSTRAVQPGHPWTVKLLRNYHQYNPHVERAMTHTPTQTIPDRNAFADAAEVFQLLSTPVRLHLLWFLSNDEVDVTTLVHAIGSTKAGVSQHLAKLRLAGWIEGRRDGRHILYRVVDPHIVTLVHQGVEHVLDERAARTPTSGVPSSVPGPTRTASSGMD